MPHIILLGDSIFDNASYTGGDPDVIAQVRRHLQAGWKASLLAVDGAITEDLAQQLAKLPFDATHLVLSIGGNNALRQQDILNRQVCTTAEAFNMLAGAVEPFEASYRKAVGMCMSRKLPLIVCTIYNGNFSDHSYQRLVKVALSAFNDVIIRVATENRVDVIELRQICETPEDYANPIEPSSTGGEKIAKVIVREIQGRTHGATHTCIAGK